MCYEIVELRIHFGYKVTQVLLCMIPQALNQTLFFWTPVPDIIDQTLRFPLSMPKCFFPEVGDPIQFFISYKPKYICTIYMS